MLKDMLLSHKIRAKGAMKNFRRLKVFKFWIYSRIHCRFWKGIFLPYSFDKLKNFKFLCCIVHNSKHQLHIYSHFSCNNQCHQVWKCENIQMLNKIFKCYQTHNFRVSQIQKYEEIKLNVRGMSDFNVGNILWI